MKVFNDSKDMKLFLELIDFSYMILDPIMSKIDITIISDDGKLVANK